MRTIYDTGFSGDENSALSARKIAKIEKCIALNENTFVEGQCNCTECRGFALES